MEDRLSTTILNREVQGTGTYSSDELIIFSAPWVIISNNSSLLAAAKFHSINLLSAQDIIKERQTFGLLSPPLLYNQLIQPQLLRCPLQHTFFYTPFRDKSKYIHLLRLPDPMCAVHCL
jgi:hypothetical protein